MLTVYPDYYPHFSCIAGACRHNCCIGWEIDIDEDTALYYQSVSGPMASRLKTNISRDNPPHFILDSHDRCPFLNANNLCDIILSFGVDHLCTICSEHPRFHNVLPGRRESGVGLCCEEAARLILGWERPAALCVSGSAEVEDDLIEIRDHVIKLLQNREKPIRERTENVLNYAKGILPQKSMEEWADFFLGLERLDEQWTTLLTLLREQWHTVDTETFDKIMLPRETEYEQLLVYFVYRHMANAPDEEELSLRAGFAVLGYEIVHALGALLWSTRGSFSFADQTELARLFSSEIEYSQDNMDAVLDFIYEEQFLD